ncbi:MAG: class I mannose-6-phosphate isomerase [Clostridia bacterium]|nr:class I mannose-6-phosphate isomerase [Clostridia bacterium]
MSFMFHPYPYSDPNAVNCVTGRGVKPVAGIQNVAAKIAELVKAGKNIGIDMYPGADVVSLVNVLRQKLAGTGVCFVDAASLLKSSEEIEEMLAPYLPTDRERDPVLLYGVRYKGGYEGLQAAEKVEALKKALAEGKSIVVYGQGALAPELQKSYDLRVWMDVTPRTAVLSYKNGHARNIGAKTDLPYNLTMRRNYYVDFEIAVEVRWNMFKAGLVDLYISADVPETMQMVTMEDLLTLFGELVERPFRCRPVYLEGVWGGYYIQRLRNLPKEMRNCAWVFDMIPMEVSIVAKTESYEFEAPFFTFVQVMGEKLLGAQAMKQFGGYFPIRFNYDDTYHGSGNMSIQCHPDAEYVMKNHDELGRQDESYYVCVTGQGAKTYLGFCNDDSCEEFFKEARRVEGTTEQIDYKKYINYVDSEPGTQVMIPAGTIHASGQNQVILEIGSLTVGSYTYKLYDYQRLDPQTNMPRPIHLTMGSEVIRGERTKKFCDENLVSDPFQYAGNRKLVREGEGWKEIITGEHDLLYFSLRNLIFDQQIEDNTDGLFHVLALVDGEKVKVASKADPSKYFIMNTMDIIVLPASLGEYTITNLGCGTVTIHKTQLKKEC